MVFFVNMKDCFNFWQGFGIRARVVLVIPYSKEVNSKLNKTILPTFAF